MTERRGGAAEDERVVRRFVDEVLNGGDHDALAELVAADCRLHLLGTDTELAGRADLERHLRRSERAFDDRTVTIESLVAEAGNVVFRGRVEGEHAGPFEGPAGALIPASGRRFSVATFQQYRLDDGVIVEGWRLVDTLSLARQLGWLPSSPAGLARHLGRRLRELLAG